MLASTDHGRTGRGATRRPPRAPRAWVAGIVYDLRAQQQRVVDRRLMRELPDHLLKDMGISRAQIGVPADPTAAGMLRQFAGWR